MRVLFLGDSLVDGFPTLGGFRSTVCKNFPLLECVGSVTDRSGKCHEGHPHYTVELVEERLDEWLNASKPDIVVVLVGANNLPTDTPEYIVQHIATVVQMIRKKVAGHIFVSTFSYVLGFENQVAKVNSLLKNNVRNWGRNVHLVDMGSVPQFPTMFADECHPNEIGHRLMGDVLSWKMAEVFGWPVPAQSKKPYLERFVHVGDQAFTDSTDSVSTSGPLLPNQALPNLADAPFIDIQLPPGPSPSPRVMSSSSAGLGLVLAAVGLGALVFLKRP